MTTGNTKNVRGAKKPLEGRYIISEFNVATGEPLGQYAQKFVYHYGYLVRDKLPINAREWKKITMLLILVMSLIRTRS